MQTFQLVVLRHRCRKISMALRDKQRQSKQGHSYASMKLKKMLMWAIHKTHFQFSNQLSFVIVVLKFLWFCEISKGKARRDIHMHQ